MFLKSTLFNFEKGHLQSALMAFSDCTAGRCLSQKIQTTDKAEAVFLSLAVGVGLVANMVERDFHLKEKRTESLSSDLEDRASDEGRVQVLKRPCAPLASKTSFVHLKTLPFFAADCTAGGGDPVDRQHGRARLPAAEEDRASGGPRSREAHRLPGGPSGHLRVTPRRPPPDCVSGNQERERAAAQGRQGGCQVQCDSAQGAAAFEEAFKSFSVW